MGADQQSQLPLYRLVSMSPSCEDLAVPLVLADALPAVVAMSTSSVKGFGL